MQNDLVQLSKSWSPFSVNTFSGKGRSLAAITPVHHVAPHYVQGHFRDGKYISGYWRDGDGNTKVNTYRGYYAKNLGAVPTIISIGDGNK